MVFYSMWLSVVLSLLVSELVLPHRAGLLWTLNHLFLNAGISGMNH